MTMTPADRSREQYETAVRALDRLTALLRTPSGDEPAVIVAAHAAWEAGYWAALHDRSRAAGPRVTANPFDPTNPVAVEDYPQPAPTPTEHRQTYQDPIAAVVTETYPHPWVELIDEAGNTRSLRPGTWGKDVWFSPGAGWWVIRVRGASDGPALWETKPLALHSDDALVGCFPLEPPHLV